MNETYFTVRREAAGMTVDYPYKCRTAEEAETVRQELARYTIGGTFTVVEHQQARKPTFRF